MLILQDNAEVRRVVRVLFEAAGRDAVEDAAAGFAALRRIRCRPVRAFEETAGALSAPEARQLCLALVKRAAAANLVELELPDAPALVQAFDTTLAKTEPVPCLRLLDRRWMKDLKAALKTGVAARLPRKGLPSAHDQWCSVALGDFPAGLARFRAAADHRAGE